MECEVYYNKKDYLEPGFTRTVQYVYRWVCLVIRKKTYIVSFVFPILKDIRRKIECPTKEITG
ncbi:hypothetical protein CSV60_05795 [Sporosarcina sp. P7]|nr:hypothetical protein CSV60_05795 [Sporosarcina sp. P7]